MIKSVTPQRSSHRSLVWFVLLLLGICVVSGGCGGGHGSIGGNADVEALNNKTFTSPTGATGEGTANGGTAVTLSDVSVSFTNVAASNASVESAATKGNVAVSYKLTVGTVSQDFYHSSSDVEITEESSGVYAFKLDDMSFKIDPSSGKFSLDGTFTLGGTTYKLDKPIEIEIGVGGSVNVNSIWDGGWVYQSGTAKTLFMNNEVSFKVQQLAMYFEDSNVSVDEGTSTISAVICLSADPTVAGQSVHLRVPVFFDKEAVKTKRTDSYEWTASTDHGVFTIDINPETNVANLQGYTRGTSTDVSLDVVMQKATASTIDVDSVLEGTWTVLSEGANGGFIYSSAIGGTAAMNNGYINAFFDDVDISKGTAHMTTVGAMPATINFFTSTSSSNIVLPLILSADMKIEHIFGSIYSFDIPNDYQPTRGVIIVEPTDTNRAALIVNSATKTNSVNMNVLFHIQKKTAADVDPKTIAKDAVWTADTDYADRTGGIIYSHDMEVQFAPLTMSKDAPFEVSFDADFAKKQITVSADGAFTVGGTVNVKVGDLLKRTAGEDTMTLDVQAVGSNMLYAESGSGKSTFAVVLVDTESAYVFADIAPTGKKDDEACSLAGYMKKKQ